MAKGWESASADLRGYNQDSIGIVTAVSDIARAVTETLESLSQDSLHCPEAEAEAQTGTPAPSKSHADPVTFFLFFFFGHTSRGLWDLSSLTRD